MTKYDKYDPISGGFRAKLSTNLTLNGEGGFFGGVSLNAAGRVVVGTSGQTGLVGVCVKNVAHQPLGRFFTDSTEGVPNPNAPIAALAGSVVDIMTNGDIVDLDKTAFPAGSKVYTSAAGVISTTSATGSRQIGFTVEAGRLVVRIAVTDTVAA